MERDEERNTHRKLPLRSLLREDNERKVDEAYTACEKTLQEELALSNSFLKAVSAIHPDASGHSVTLTFLQKLPYLAPNFLTEEETNTYDLKTRKYQTDDLPEFEDGTMKSGKDIHSSVKW
ncbi:Hypothetical predicted protein [Mytilus galloprovincialis]|uniref:Uncharacterized protein n=1 Tax=Mytilus galloprovincialis TaxID=29158 RepID=A0A8B6HAY8_MYTGA|nr:Hypothetical predicted protein [Mytilus galloprovincialis]